MLVVKAPPRGLQCAQPFLRKTPLLRQHSEMLSLLYIYTAWLQAARQLIRHDVDVHVHHALEQDVRPLLALDLHVPLDAVTDLSTDLREVRAASAILSLPMPSDLKRHQVEPVVDINGIPSSDVGTKQALDFP